MTKAEELKKEAKRLDACDRGMSDWDNLHSDLDLIQKYVKESEFCIKHDFPNMEYIKENFSKDMLHKGGVWIDDEILSIPERKSVLNGHCFGSATFSGITSRLIRIRHTSEIELIADGNSRLFVHIYDDVRLKVNTKNQGRIYVYQHGGTIVAQSGDVIVRECRKEGVVE